MNAAVDPRDGGPPRLRTWVLAISIGLSLLLLFAALLVSLRLEKALSDLVEARAVLMARQLADVGEGGLRFGVPLANQTELPGKIADLTEGDTGLRSVSMLDDQGRVIARPRSGDVPKLTVDTRQVQRLMARKSAAGSEPPRKVWLDGTDFHVLMQVRDASGAAAGVVWAVYSAREPQAAFGFGMRRLALWALALAAGVSLLAGALLWQMARRGAQLLDELDRPSGALATAAWPVLPLPQALRSLASAEGELSALTGPAQQEEHHA